MKPRNSRVQFRCREFQKHPEKQVSQRVATQEAMIMWNRQGHYDIARPILKTGKELETEMGQT